MSGSPTPVAAQEDASSVSARPAPPPVSGHREALKAAVAIGGSSAANALCSMVRVKCVAVILGPSGVGLIGAYSAITGMIGGLAGMGIGTSSVREVAEALGQGDEVRLARLAIAIRRASLILGALGTLAMILLSPWLSQWTFGDTSYSRPLAVLSLVVICGSIATGQMALLQGTRRIGDLARTNVIGAVLSTLVSVPLVWIWGLKGVVPFLVIVQAMAIATCWWFARKVPLVPVRLPWRETLAESASFMRLGLWIFAAMIGGTGTIYLIRVILIRELGMDAAGQYQAAANLASMYVGFVLGAMGTDFYPRLTGVSQDHVAMSRMINQQAEISLLLAAPGILATLCLAPLVIDVFYARSFAEAVGILRWQVLGVLFRVISWPLGFAVLAKGRGELNLVTDVAANCVWLAATWVGTLYFGVKGAGIAFLVLYLFSWALMIVVVRRMIGFAYSDPFRRVLWLLLPAALAGFIAVECLPYWWGIGIAGAVTLGVSIYCGNALARLVPDSRPARLWEGVLKAVWFLRIRHRPVPVRTGVYGGHE